VEPCLSSLSVAVSEGFDDVIYGDVIFIDTFAMDAGWVACKCFRNILHVSKQIVYILLFENFSTLL